MSSPSENSPESKPRKIPQFVKPLFEMGTEIPAPVEADQDIDDPKGEAHRVIKRLVAIVEDHTRAAKLLHLDLSADDVLAVIASLQDHAKGGKGVPVSGGRDEIHSYCLDRLFEELVEEPSNILFTTQKGEDSVRYDAMNASFWLECLDLFGRKYSRL